MAATTVENLEFHIKKSGSGGASEIRDLASALRELQQAKKGAAIPQSLVDSISALAGAMKAIDSAAISKMRQLAAALKTFDGLQNVKIKGNLAAIVADLGAAADLVNDKQIQTLSKFGAALQNFGGKASVDKNLADRLLDIGFAMTQITDESVGRLERMAEALSKLKGVNLSGFSKAVAKVQKDSRSVQKVQDAAQAAGLGNQTPAGGQTTESLRQIDKLEAKVIAAFGRMKKAVKSWASSVREAFSKEMNWNFSWKNNLKQIQQYWAGVGQAITSFVGPGMRVFISLLGAAVSLAAKLAVQIAKIAVNIAKGIVSAAANLVKKIATGIANITKKIVSAAANIAKKVLSIAQNLIKKIGSGLASLGKMAVNLGKSFGEFLYEHSTIRKITDVFQKLQKVISSLARIAFYRIIRSAIKYVTDAIKEGSENAYFYSKQFGNSTKYISESLDSLATNSYRMKNQVGAAWASMLAALEPILIQLINLVAKAAEVVTQFFAVLGGKTTYLKAINYAQNWADAEEEGAEAAKEWKNQLMDFDELNRLEEPSDSSGKSGKKIPNYGEMFEEAEIDDWFKNLKDMLENGEWAEIGRMLGEKFNDLVNGFDWAGWGTKIGQKIQNAIELAYNFLSTADFKNLGAKIAEFVNRAGDEINFNTLGRLVTRLKTALWDVLYGALVNLEWDKWGKRLSDYIIGRLDELADWLETLEPAKIAKALKDFFGNIDYGGIRDSFVRVVKTGWQKAVELYHEIFDEETKQKIKTALKNFFGGINWGEIRDKIVEKLSWAWDKVIDLKDRIWTSETKEKVKTALTNFFHSIKWGEIRDKIVEKLEWAWSKAVEMKDKIFTEERKEKIKGYISDWWNNIKWDEVAETIRSKLEFAWNTAMATLDKIWPPDKREEFMGQVKTKVQELLQRAINAIDFAAIHNVLSYKLDAAIFGESWAAFWWSKGDYAGKEIIMGMIHGEEYTAPQLAESTNTFLSEPVNGVLAGLAENGLTEGGNLSRNLANGIIGESETVSTAVDNGIVQPAQTKANWLIELLRGSGKSAAYALAGSVIEEQPTVDAAMDSGLVKPADNAVVAFLKKIGLINTGYAADAETWKQISGDVEKTTTEDYDTIGTEVPQSIDSMRQQLDGTTVAVYTLFETMRDMSARAAESMKDRIKSAFTMLKDAVSRVGDSMGTAIRTMVETIGTGLKNTWEGITNGIKSMIDGIKSVLGIGSGGSSVFVNIGQSMVSGLQKGFGDLWSSFSSTVSSLVQTLISGISTAVQQGFSGLSGAIGTAVSNASSKLHELAAAAKNSIETLLGNARNSLSGIVASVQSTINSIIAKANSILSKLKAKSYATGGFPEDGIFFANHSELVGQFSNGKTAVANNEQIITGIRQGVYEAVTQAMGSSSNGNGANDQAINIYIGDELVYSGYAAWNRRQQVITGGRT